MQTLVLKNARIVDGGGARGAADVVVEDEVVVAIEPAGSVGAAGREVVDLAGLLLLPGLVDIQVHFRTPGPGDAEDLASGTAAAAAGGVTAVLMMANTDPPLDTPDRVREVLAAARSTPIDVHTAATITVGRAGERLVDVDGLHAAGVRVLTDDGSAVMDSAVMRAALEATTRLPGLVISQHAEDEALVAGGAINEGVVARTLGVGGRPVEAEEIVVGRDLVLARLTGGRYHVLHLSGGRSLELVRRARAAGVRVTCEVTPQHLVLTEDDVPRLGTHGKMNPPLRTEADVAALRGGLADGTIDAIATDHAPHAPAAKARPLAEAPPGMLGVETMASVVWTHLVGPGVLSPDEAVRLLSRRPAALLGLGDQGQPIVPGSPATLCVLDPEERWIPDATALHSRSANNPFAGTELRGRVRATLVRGRVVADRSGLFRR